MPDEAKLVETGSGVVPQEDGWFVVNVRDAAWLTNPAFGARCVFESDTPVLRQRPDLTEQRFDELGVRLAVLEPGKPSGLYHAESAQEAFLVIEGECTAVVEGQERQLRQWDFLHCPPGTAHVFVGGGDRCVLLMIGARTADRTITYPREETALRHGAGVEAETSSPREAYALFPHWQPGRPGRDGLPWTG